MDGHAKQKEQSKRMIEDALFELLEEKEYAELTVMEIVKQADVARRTFYRLYGGKEDIIPGYFKRLCNEYQNSSKALQAYNLQQIAIDYFSFWYERKERILCLHKAGMDAVLYNEIRNASLEVISRRIGNERLRELPELVYFADYSTGGFVNLLIRWINGGMQETPEQYARIVSTAIIKFVSDKVM